MINNFLKEKKDIVLKSKPCVSRIALLKRTIYEGNWFAGLNEVDVR